MVNVDGNHQIVVQQYMVAWQMVFGEIDTPLKDVGIHGASMAFELTGNYLNPVTTAESVVKTHRLQRFRLIMEHTMEGSRFAGIDARNRCQSTPNIIPLRFAISLCLVKLIGTFHTLLFNIRRLMGDSDTKIKGLQTGSTS